MSEEQDFTWLKLLHDDLWRRDTRSKGEKLAHNIFPDRGKTPPEPAREKLTHGEVRRLFDLVGEHRLITELFPCGMICGVGLAIYSHEVFIGTGVQKLLAISDEHLPGYEPLSWHAHVMGKDVKKLPKRKPGACDPYAWDLFTKYANRPENVEWIKKYKLRPVKDKMYYDY